MTTLSSFIHSIPKAELHLHIEGTLEPELLFQLAKRNTIPLKYASVDELKKAYNFNNLQDFLDIYYQWASVLITQQDFYDLTRAYLEKIHTQNVVHTEIFFDPQTHTDRGISFDTVITWIHNALEDGQKKLGITYKIILCFLRHLDEASAMKTLDEALPYKDRITAVGLDSSEVGNPPSKFEKVFSKARTEWLLTVAHAGEEWPAAYIWEAINMLKISRIDHGNHSIDDPKLLQTIIEKRLPLTMCPLSNLKLKVQTDLSNHPLKTLMNKGVLVTINSDDPAYFWWYIEENYVAIAEALHLSQADIIQLAKNSFEGSFLDEENKKEMRGKIDAIAQ